MSIDPQRDVRLRVAETLADRHDIHAGIDQLAGMSVAQRMEGHCGHSDAGGKLPPCLTAGDGRERGAFEIGEQQGVIRKLSGAKLHAEFKLSLAMVAQRIDQDIGQGDIAASGFSVS
jgi:hypothetical protein